MNGCYYASLMGEVFGLTQLIPTIVTYFLTATSFFFRGFFILWIYGFYLHAVQLLLWVIQVYLEQVRPDPTCQIYQSFAFPSIAAFYVASIFTFFALYSYYWYVEQSWLVWFLSYIVLAGVPVILVANSYNHPWEVAVSMFFGIAFTWIYVIVLRLYICPTLPFLLNEFPCSTLGYTDTFLMSEEENLECIRCHAALNTNVVRS